jgi:uncharacterized membrane protein
MSDKMQQQMKARLENLPRYTYKTVAYFTTKDDVQKVVDELVNKGIMDLNSRTLSSNYIEEIYELSPFFKKEFYTFLKAFSIGGILGAIIGSYIGKLSWSFPLLNPLLAGGLIVCVIFGFFIGAILASTLFGILSLYEPIVSVEPGYHMLSIYSDIEKKQDIQNILNKYSVIKI